MDTQAIVIEPIVTRRAVIDPLRLCHLRCDFCYYLHGDMQSVRPWPEVRDELRRHAERDCTAVDVTGGEPLRYPQITELVAECKSLGMSVRVISSLIAAPGVVEQAIKAGVDGFLVSCHGSTAVTHDAIVHVTNARAIQHQRLEQLAGRAVIDLNYVIVSANQDEIERFATYCQAWHPRIVNFINFNPHYEWRKRPETASLVADLRLAGPQLDAAIDVLESVGIGVNVRYYPMCAVSERHRKNICNDLHVPFDSGEWNNAIASFRTATAYQYGFKLSQANEEKGDPCNRCDLQWICGGANRHWHQASRQTHGEQLVAINLPADIDRRDWYHYRRNNALGMA